MHAQARQERDVALLRRLRSGDRAASAELCEAYRRLIWRLAKRLKSRHHTQEDLAQEGIVALLEWAGRYDVSGQASFCSYVYAHLRGRLLRVRRQGLIRAKSFATAGELTARTVRQRTAALRFPESIQDEHARTHTPFEDVDQRDAAAVVWERIAEHSLRRIYSVVSYLVGTPLASAAARLGVWPQQARELRRNTFRDVRGDMT